MVRIRFLLNTVQLLSRIDLHEKDDVILEASLHAPSSVNLIDASKL